MRAFRAALRGAARSLTAGFREINGSLTAQATRVPARHTWATSGTPGR
jgi:hypothetical protein